MKKFTVLAVDGGAGTGKSTLSNLSPIEIIFIC